MTDESPPEPLSPSNLTAELPADGLCRVLSLDGGGAKGFYSLGVLMEIEALIGCPLYKRFDLVFGTSTGAIIAALIALGFEVSQIHELYKKYVPAIMKEKTSGAKTKALEDAAKKVFGKKKFDSMKTGVGVVTTKWIIERPMIFKTSVAQAHGRMGTYVPGFGCTIAEAVQASCSAYPFFDRKIVKTSAGDDVELVDGGYCANNPTLYALADAIVAMQVPRSDVRVVSIGVGEYPAPKDSWKMYLARKYLLSVQLLQKTLDINTQSMDQLRAIMFKDVQTVRISDKFSTPDMATDLFEHNEKKLNILRQRGRESFAEREATLRQFLL